MDLADSLVALKGLGVKSAEKFEKLGIFSVEDLLLYHPFRYEDFKSKQVTELADGEKAVIVGNVVTPPTVSYYGFKRNRLSFKLKQDEAVIGVHFFNQTYLQDKVTPGDKVAIFGKWDARKTSLFGMKILAQATDDMQPVYHVAQGISQKVLVSAIRTAIDTGYLALLPENLPDSLLDRYRLVNRQTAIRSMHFPKNEEDYRQALRRLKFEEFFYFQLRLQVMKARHHKENAGLSLDYDKARLVSKMKTLPFELTPAQEVSLGDILDDMASSKHMNRLLQGDVGSGKTIVASLAMYAAYTAGYQSALMVPTEILAEQHASSLKELFPELRLATLTSSMKIKDKRDTLSAIADGTVDMIVGTHALIQEGVSYYKLGLVITDEQHRFGVNQRRLFREKGIAPDVLMMTATPIPRTLAITAFGEMDVSIIDQMPAGRKPIKTRWVKHHQMPEVLSWIREKVFQGAQVYVVSPLIEESESLDLKNAIALHQELTTVFGQDIKVALMHGRMKSDEKDKIMMAFKAKEVDVLVSTTVIEVGVNVPNATIMVIMDADRFGLSQLHQLRGRVGRGDKQSYAILVANPKTDSGNERMKIMCNTTDGFVLAEEDLKMRGSGELFGTRQSGLPEFKIANMIDDYVILEEARKTAAALVAEEGWQTNPAYAMLDRAVLDSPVFD